MMKVSGHHIQSARMNPLEIFAVAFGIVSVYLSVRENVWSWPTAIINVSLYIFVFHETKLYADMGLQVIYIGISIYGWYQWLYGGTGKSELKVSRIPKKQAAVLAVIGIAFSVALGTFLHRTTDAALPFVDSATTSTSLVAQYMMTRKYLENWAVWVAVDVVYIGMFIFKSLYLTAGLYAAFLILSALGLRRWWLVLRRAEGSVGASGQ